MISHISGMCSKVWTPVNFGSEDPDEMPLNFIGLALFAKINTIVRDSDTSFMESLTGKPLNYKMDNSTHIVSICMG